MKIKRLTLVLLTVCLCVCLLGVTASAATIGSGTCGDNLSWTLDDEGVLTVFGSGDMYNFDYSGAPWYIYRDQITTLVIEEGVTGIGDYAVWYFPNLTQVSIADSVTRYGYGAFAGCDGLTTFHISANVASIGDRAFSYCPNLTKITVDAKNANYAAGKLGVLYNKTKTTLILVPGGFAGACAIPKSVTTIGPGAFEGCTGLTAVTIGQNVTEIGNYAFSGCTGLSKLVIPATVKAIGNGAFEGCSNLTKVTLNSGLTTIGDYAFCDCSGLTAITIPDSVTAIGEGAFEWCTNLSKLTLGSGITAISDYIFRNCSSLTSVVLPGGIKTIGNHAFAGCNAMNAVLFSGSAPKIGSSAFSTIAVKCYYPEDDASWTKDVKQSYGGTITWASFRAASITTQPATVKAKAGTTATFTVAAEGMDLHYQWQFRTPSGKWMNTTAKGNKTATLTVPATVSRSAYRYRCVITDATGKTVTSKVAYLYVLGVKTQPATAKVVSGTKATFTVAATGHNKTFQWQYRTGAKSEWKNATAKGNKTATLTVPATVGRSAYQYRCVIKDSAGNEVTTKAAYLYVLGVQTQPTAQTVKAGTKATFTVKATGHSKTFQWQYRTSATGKWFNATAKGNKTATMTVPATVKRNGYQYRCVISDSAGNQVYTYAVKLNVLGIQTQPADKTVKADVKTTFTVKATGKDLTYQWQFLNTKGAWINATAKGNKTATLTVKATAALNGRQYRCVITDAKGNTVTTKAATLTVK